MLLWLYVSKGHDTVLEHAQSYTSTFQLDLAFWGHYCRIDLNLKMLTNAFPFASSKG